MAIQREIEMAGLSTVLITVVPEQSRAMGPPRAVAPIGFKLGNSTGGVFQADLQRRVVLDALQRVVTPMEPGIITPLTYPDYVPTLGINEDVETE